MNEVEKPPKLVLYGGVAVFILISVAAFIWFAWSMFSLAVQVIALSSIISLDKGALYFFGVSLGLGGVSVFMVVELYLGKPPSEKFGKFIGRWAISGLVIMLIVPHFVHYSLDSYLMKKQYSICEKASHAWLHARTIVYMKNQADCDAIE
ncbi:hypothetical protein [Teredinibacter sp. KSP-S5-2]|uniref:hypothetical protein n=1 Tax=Teredinibacter sp. KSP-S5-2 TaxID=3034506 RepID=UPI00293448D9|nr:hypothetical protein [Teredinibacter sp. KSP-S5-2]WNO08047.1 hypothetical protein P5V12_13780 [Teredinibacter sp. KSP-S5-2]